VGGENGHGEHCNVLFNQTCCYMRSVVAEIEGMVAVVGRDSYPQGIRGRGNPEESFETQA
jgi:hypothetical protein